jgi:amino acid adenylation domain-containing protein/thioester reductase-like protein
MRAIESSQLLPQLLTVQAQATPDAIALVFNNQQLTYRQLADRTNQLAHYLQAMGVQPETTVGIYVERSLEMVIAMLSVLKAGGAYVPLDPSFPPDRVAFMVEDAQMPILLSQQHLQLDNAPSELNVINLDADWETIAQQPTTAVEANITANSLAYIIYTSGSTGKPKGVQIQHGNLANLLASMATEPGLTHTDTLLAITTYSFDLSVPDWFLPLVVGAKMVVLPREIATNPVKLAEEINQSGATFMQATPTTWRMLLAAKWTGSDKLKILCGGEAMTRSLADQLLTRCAELWNMYGPTETTVWSMLNRVEPGPNPITLGHPIANTQIHILPQEKRRHSDTVGEIGDDEIGELYIGGDGVARGYLNRAELNQEKFILDPFSQKPGAKMYRTGDLARYLPNGDLEIVGRADNQVKIRGYRIELGDIEAALSDHPAVHEVAVIAPEDATGGRRLLGYVVLKPDQSITSLELCRWLGEKLPAYMVPGIIMFLPAMPMTPNCKIDRRALPVPRLDAQMDLVPARNPLEKQLLELWSAVLEVEVGIYHNFLESGGDSLKTALLLSRIQETFEIDIPLECLFKAPTVTGFAKILMEVQASGSAAAFQMTPADLLEEAQLDAAIRPQTPIKANQNQLFITGATGFIGAFLVQELLQRYPEAKLYCLVRARSQDAAAKRLRQVMEQFEIWEDEFGPRIIPILGDLELPMFGLSERQFRELADKVDIIYHSGAYVNLVYPYAALRNANVQGTQEILRLATIGQTIPVHYLSTVDVFHSTQYLGRDAIFEADELPTAEGYFEGYAQSKWVAEKLVMAARDRGLPVCIYRLGMITGHTQTGGFQLGNLVCRMIKGFMQMGTAPDLNMPMVLAPVDYVVQAIAHLSYDPMAIGKTFHIVSPYRLTIQQFVADLNALGQSIQLIPYAQWQAQLQHMPAENALIPTMSMFKASPHHPATPIETSTFVEQTHDARQAELALASTGITCPAITREILQVYVGYLQRAGFLPLELSELSVSEAKVAV